jgi:hypothetical protein
MATWDGDLEPDSDDSFASFGEASEFDIVDQSQELKLHRHQPRSNEKIGSL